MESKPNVGSLKMPNMSEKLLTYTKQKRVTNHQKCQYLKKHLSKNNKITIITKDTKFKYE